MTAMHNSKELVSVQMVLYTILDLLHGIIHNKPETVNILKKTSIWIVPYMNPDGFQLIT